MANNLSGWINRIFRRSSPSPAYDPLSNGTNRMPGAFPTGSEGNNSTNLQPQPQSQFEEDTNHLRNNFNSHNINIWFKKLLNWFNYLIIKPIIILLVVSFRILSKILNVIYFKDNGDDLILINNHNGHGNHRRSGSHNNIHAINDPINRVNKFIQDLEDNLTPEQLSQSPSVNQSVGDSHLPPFYQGSYSQALYMTTNRAKFLFIYLTNPYNENSSIIFKKIITNGNFISMFQTDPDLLIWGGDLTNPEAYQLANSLNVTKFPFLGLLCLTRSTTMTQSGPVKTSPKVSLVSKLQGGLFNEDMDINQLIKSKFHKKIEKYAPELSVIRNELRDKFMSQVLIKQQEINFNNSLRKDQLKKKEKLHRELKKQYLLYIAPQFRSFETNSGGQGDTARIAIKLNNGKRVTYYFPKENKVEDIFTMVELIQEGYLESNETLLLTDLEASQKFKDFKLEYKFKLLSPLPPRVILNELMDEQIKNVDTVYPSGLLVIEDL
ncbi:hypothetical protein DFJ63DRAFT_169454 [Scheffersomyces coipomensis]|uniref:uncharacterized protein n=1 Tax=Scheffersomyces coipomensis TaxID=1788519 RepID=UPI00315C821A